jgi:hypothetical protein
LGVGIEYVPSAIVYFERMRQMEEAAEHISVLAGPISSLLASDQFETALEQVLKESLPVNGPRGERALSEIPKVMEILRERKATFRRRRPGIVNLISANEIGRFLRDGFVGSASLPNRVINQRREMARAEVEHFAKVIENQPIGTQIGIATDNLPHTSFHIYRQPDRSFLVLSPFRLGEQPNIHLGVAMITSAPEALSLHRNLVEDVWHRALKGEAATAYLKKLLEEN